MAIFNLYRQSVPVLGATADAPIMSSTQLQIVSGSVKVNFYGTGLTYGYYGVTGGVITGIDYYNDLAGGLQYEITGLHHNAQSAFDSILGHGTLEYLFDGNDTIHGSPLNDSLNGYAGTNLIDGAGGDDTLKSYGVDDTLIGGEGNDTYIIDYYQNETVIEQAGQGIDTILVWGNYTLPANVENLTGNGGSGDLVGNDLPNLIVANGSHSVRGGGGQDTLRSGGESSYGTILYGDGNDHLQGGTAGDQYVLTTAGDILTDEGGRDYVLVSFNYAMPWFVEDARMADAALYLTANDGNNELDGNDIGNVIDAAGGNDHIDGRGGNDRIDGGDGNDTAFGGEGNDTLLGGSGDDSLWGMEGNDSIVGGDGNDTLYGVSGVDRLEGGFGNDTYLYVEVGEIVIEPADGGHDVIHSMNGMTLPDNVEDLILEDDPTQPLIGNVLNNLLVGRQYSQQGDILDGRAGADTMRGMGGSDTYYIDNIGDVIEEDPDHYDFDRLFSSISVDLAAFPGMEELTLFGAANIDGTGAADIHMNLAGNDGNNVLTLRYGGEIRAGAGNDTLYVSSLGTMWTEGRFVNLLDGGAGNDTMHGSSAADVYYVDSASDVVIEPDGNSEFDEVRSTASHDLPANVESLVMEGTANIDAASYHGGTLRGNGGNNALTGGVEMFGLAGNDTLTGNMQTTLMVGGAGDDTYYAPSADTVIEELPDGGFDTLLIGEATDFILPANFEALKLLDGVVSARGNYFANDISGNSGHNSLDGGEGADTLRGGAGDDDYYVDNIGDVVVEAAGGGIDTVYMRAGYWFSSYSLVGTEVERLFMFVPGESAGYGNDAATGNALNNYIAGYYTTWIDGGAGADTMSGAQNFVVDNLGDVILDSDYGLESTVITSLANYTLASFLYHLAFTGPAATGFGNVHNNLMTGSAFNDQLSGNAGHDTIEGRAGSDRLVGGEGSDKLDGGNGNDTLDGGDGDDLLLGDAGLDTAIYTRPQSDYTIDIDGDGDVYLSRFDAGGELVEYERLRGVDQIAFSNKTVVLNKHVATATVTLPATLLDSRELTVAVSNIVDADGVQATPSGLSPYRYTWYRDGAAVGETSRPAYMIYANDAGHSFSVSVWWVDGDGNFETVWSAAPTTILPADHTRPYVVARTPAKDSTGADIAGNIVLKFSEPIEWSGSGLYLMANIDNQWQTLDIGAPSSVSVAGDTLVFNPPANLPNSTQISVGLYEGAVRDLSGNPVDQFVFQFRTAAKVINGTAASEFLQGTAKDDVIHGFAGNDTIEGGAGRDTIDGGAGIDTLRIQGSYYQTYVYDYVDGLPMLATPAGYKVYDGIERIQSNDYIQIFDTGVGSSVWRADALLHAALGSEPGLGLLSDWTHRADSSNSTAALAQRILDAYAPGLPTSVMVEHLFHTVLKVDPSPSDVAWVTSLVGPGQAFANNAALYAYVAEMDANTSQLMITGQQVAVLEASWF